MTPPIIESGSTYRFILNHYSKPLFPVIHSTGTLQSSDTSKAHREQISEFH